VLFNAHHEGVEFTIDPDLGTAWSLELATDADAGERGRVEPRVILPGRSLRILRRDA
jgi:hypothetical protein